jgi:peptidylprolyl isomerase
VKPRVPRALVPVTVVLAATLALAACGASSSPTASSSASGASGATGPVSTGDCAGTPTGADYEVGNAGVIVTGGLDAAPVVKLGPDTSKVTKLQVCDLVQGTGAAVAAGSSITAQYLGIGAVSGKKFDASWDRGQPSTFSLAQVIPGWTNGIPGMKVGGRRLLVIPGDQAYGANPPSADIAKDEALVFVVDAVPTPVPTVGPHVEGTAGVTVTGEAGKAPTLTVSPETAKVTDLTISDITVGTGAEATAGAKVTMHYVGAVGTTGKTFDSSWTTGKPVTFDLTQIITGIADGVPGMKVGGRRLIVMTAAQGFGANPPSGLAVKANEPLVFVVDLVSVP